MSQFDCPVTDPQGIPRRPNENPGSGPNENPGSGPSPPPPQDVSAVAAGAEFTIWLCDGALMSAGNPQYGQLGHGSDHEYNQKEGSVKLVRKP